MTTRCTGHCCQAFWLSVPYERIRDTPETLHDGEYLRDMLIPLGLQDVEPSDGSPIDPPQHLYTCRHFDEVASSCRQYKSRPGMCRSHGSDDGCRYSACTLKPDLVQIGGLGQEEDAPKYLKGPRP